MLLHLLHWRGPVCSVWLEAGWTVSEQLISLQCLFQESKEQIPLPEMTRQSVGGRSTQRETEIILHCFSPSHLVFPDSTSRSRYVYNGVKFEKCHTHLSVGSRVWNYRRPLLAVGASASIMSRCRLQNTNLCLFFLSPALKKGMNFEY